MIGGGEGEEAGVTEGKGLNVTAAVSAQTSSYLENASEMDVHTRI